MKLLYLFRALTVIGLLGMAFFQYLNWRLQKQKENLSADVLQIVTFDPIGTKENLRLKDLIVPKYANPKIEIREIRRERK